MALADIDHTEYGVVISHDSDMVEARNRLNADVGRLLKSNWELAGGVALTI